MENITQTKCRKKYMLFGFLFGTLFPIIAFVIRYFENGLDYAVELMQNDPLFWIIFLAPVILGLASYFAGLKQDEAKSSIAECKIAELKLKDANDQVQEVLTRLQLNNDELHNSKKSNGELLFQLEQAIKESSCIIEKIGQFDLTVEYESNSEELVGERKKFAGVLNNTLSNLKTILQSVISQTEESFKISNEISSTTKKINLSIKEQNNQIIEISSAVEQATNTISETSILSKKALSSAEESGLNAKKGGEIIDKSIVGIESLSDKIQNSLDVIVDLGNSISDIGNIIEVINNIADKTNLLALNAAIESARAGEHGRGFSVVADEVRKLSESTTIATKEISEKIITIQEKTKESINSIRLGNIEAENNLELIIKAGHSLGQIIKSSDEVIDQISKVASGNENQSASAEQIRAAMENMKNVVSDSTFGINEIFSSIKVLVNLNEDLKAKISQFRVEKEVKKKAFFGVT